MFRDSTDILPLAGVALWHVSLDLKLPMIMQILSAYEGAAYLGPSPDLATVADSLAAGPIMEPGVPYASPFNLSIVTADNITPCAKSPSLLPFTSWCFTGGPSFSFFAWRVYIKKKKKKSQHFNRSRFMSNWRWYPSTLGLYGKRLHAIFTGFLFLYKWKGGLWKSFHVLLYRATCLSEFVIQNLH